jgi:hypothetical protein
MAGIHTSLVYALGFVGLAAITFIPMRAWQLTRARFATSVRRRSPVSSAVLARVVVLAVVADAWVVFRLFQCLTGEYCGPGVAHGWIFLAILGVTYLVFELLLGALRAIARSASFDES